MGNKKLRDSLHRTKRKFNKLRAELDTTIRELDRAINIIDEKEK